VTALSGDLDVGWALGRDLLRAPHLAGRHTTGLAWDQYMTVFDPLDPTGLLP